MNQAKKNSQNAKRSTKRLICCWTKEKPRSAFVIPCFNDQDENRQWNFSLKFDLYNQSRTNKYFREIEVNDIRNSLSLVQNAQNLDATIWRVQTRYYFSITKTVAFKRMQTLLTFLRTFLMLLHACLRLISHQHDNFPEWSYCRAAHWASEFTTLRGNKALVSILRKFPSDRRSWLRSKTNFRTWKKRLPQKSKENM